MTAASWRFRSVCEEDLNKVLNDYYFILKQLDCGLEISIVRYGWLEESPWGKKQTMASRPFAKISDQEIENVIEIAVPDKTKTATKYGVQIFNGKIHVYMHLTC